MEISKTQLTETSLLSKIDRTKMAEKIVRMVEKGHRSISVGLHDSEKETLKRRRVFLTDQSALKQICQHANANNIEKAISLFLTSVKTGDVLIEVRNLKGERQAVTSKKVANMINKGDLKLLNKSGQEKKFTVIEKVDDSVFSNLATEMSQNLLVDIKKEEKKEESKSENHTLTETKTDQETKKDPTSQTPSQKEQLVSPQPELQRDLKKQEAIASAQYHKKEETAELLEQEEQQAADKRRDLNKKDDNKAAEVASENKRVDESTAQDVAVDKKAANAVQLDAASDNQVHKQQEDILEPSSTSHPEVT
jgi:hypothetical protein